ncbi:MAG: hypothetical protein HFG33_04590 [Bacilli bacterium]|nr:hypothetical protein [Bacilli bacterium]
MNKKKIKNVFSKAFIISLATLAVQGIDVYAENVRETAGREIADGSYIIGITRFTNDTNITADRVLMASQDDMFFKGLSNYKKPAIYQYQLGQWIKYDTNNNPSVANDLEVAMLTHQDIYYVNNEEKILDVAYTRDIASGSELIFTTDAIGKTISYSNGVMKVPATTRSITIKVKNGSSETLVEKLEKTTPLQDGEFKYVSDGQSGYYGSISADNIITQNSDVTVNGETITIGGTIAWRSAASDHGVGVGGPSENSKSGHRVGVKITAPNGSSLESTALNQIKVFVNDEENSYSWSESTTGENSSFWFTPLVEEGKTYKVKIVWDSKNEITQTFTIVINGKLAAMPAGTLSGQEIYEKDEDGKPTDVVSVSATATGSNLLTFSGKEIPWDGRVVVNVTADDYYATNSKFTGIKGIKAYYSEPKKDVDGYDIVNKIDVPVTANYVEKTKTLTINGLVFQDTDVKRKITVSIEWDNDYTQDFDVVLDGNTPFAFPDVRLESVKTFVGYAGSDKAYKDYEVKDGVAVISNTQILWDNGNRVKAEIVPSTLVNNAGLKDADKMTRYTEEELANMTVAVDGKVQGEEKEIDGKKKFVAYTLAGATDGENDDKLSLDILVKSGNEEHTIEILWNETKVVKSYKIKLDGVALAQAVTGAYSLNGQKYASELTNGIINVYMTGFHTEYPSLEDETNGTNGVQVRDSIPFIYDINSNAVVMSFNNTSYPNGATKVEVDGKLASEESAGNYYIPVVKNGITIVKVYWDDVNVQEFRVAPHAKNGTLASFESGVLTIDQDGYRDNKTNSITYTGDIAWSGDGSQTIEIEKEKDKAGYVLKDIQIKAPIEVTTPKVTISGGKYSEDKNAENYGIVNVTLGSDKKTITIDPVVTSANETFTIKVDWNGSFIETYTVRVSGASLIAKTGSLEAKDGKSLTNYNGVIPYDHDEAGYVLETVLSQHVDNAVSKVEVDDARTKMVDGEKVLTSESTSEPKIHFNSQVRTATVKVTYADKFVQTFTINAKEATIPTIVLDSGLVAEENGEYTITAKVGENIGTIVARILPNTHYLNVENSDETIVAKNDNNTYTAKKVGSAKLVFNITETNAEDDTTMLAKPVVVNINVVNDAVGIKSVAEFDGKKILNITSDVVGGTGEGFDISLKVYELKDGLYKENSMLSDKAVTAMNGQGQYVTTISNGEEDLPEKVKLEITVRDKNYVEGEAALENLLALEEIELPKAVRYTVSFDSNGSEAVNSITVKPGQEIASKDMPVAKNYKVTAPNGNVLEYEFKGWYSLDSWNKESGLLKSDAVSVTAYPENAIKEDIKLKAYFSIVRVFPDGTTEEVQTVEK